MTLLAPYAGHIPHLSTGFVPLPTIGRLRDMSRMPEGTATLLDRIEQRRAMRGLSERALSLEVTGKPDLLRDIRRKGHFPSTENLARIAEVLGTTTDWLLGLSDDPAAVVSEVSLGEQRLDFRGPRRESPGIPLVGTGDCADLQVCADNGQMVAIERSSFDAQYHVRFITRPPALRGDREAYAIYFHGSSMEPRFQPGEIGIAQPSRPATAGDYVIVQLRGEDHDDVVSVIVKRLVRQSSREVVLEQFNPPLTFTLPKSKVKRMHRIVPPTDLLFGA